MAGVNGLYTQLFCARNMKTHEPVKGANVDIPTAATVATAGVAATFFAFLFVGLQPILFVAGFLGVSFGLYKLFDLFSTGTSTGSSSSWSWLTTYYPSSSYTSYNYGGSSPSYSSNRGRGGGFLSDGSKQAGWKQ
jgi:hypothetical protein